VHQQVFVIHGLMAGNFHGSSLCGGAVYPGCARPGSLSLPPAAGWW
jgi:hypothetical protein